MKKTGVSAAAVLLVAAMLVSLGGCGAKDTVQTEGNKATAGIEVQPLEGEIAPERPEIGRGNEISEAETPLPAKPASMENTLFIGDSRAVGIWEYAGLPADFFVSTGMTVFEATEKKIAVDGMGRITLKRLLEQKDYDRIYLMFGVNELGYPFDRIVEGYQAMVDLVSGKEPDTPLILLANLPVTAKRSQKGDYISNETLLRLNGEIEKMADGERIFYLDANAGYEDADGALSPEVTSDEVHLYAKYYPEWAEQIAIKTTEIL